MSAIFGIINKNGQPVTQQSISAMQQALMHRAVDGRGVWQSENVFLGHHALNISSIPQQERLPFEEGGLVITADVQLHNREDLFRLLAVEKEGQAAYTDPQLILAAYKKWGDGCLQYLEGEFAFVIWNKASHSLLCAVDHIGFRPLYYYDSPEMFVFSSEMKGITAVKTTPDVFNEEVLISYFFRHTDPSRTYNDEVFALCGGRKLTLENNRAKTEQYWTPQPTGKYRFTKGADWAECLRELLIQAVENRMQTDLPVGVTLSGGLDSSSIACIAGKILEKRNKPLYAFSSVLPIGHKGVEVDERDYISIVGRHLKNLDQTFVEASGAGPLTDLERVFGIEETIPNPFFYMDQAIDKAASDKGVKLLLSGFGGDFFVSWKGNSVIWQMLQQFQLGSAAKLFYQTMRHENASIVQLLKTEVVAHTHFYERIGPLLHRNKINWRDYTPLDDSFSAQYSSRLTFGQETNQVAFMKKHISNGDTSRLIGMYTNRDAAYGMSTAMPLFDKRVMDFMMDVPIAQYRIDGARRSLIRRAMEGILPPEIQWRKDKQPYSPDYITRITKNKELINSILNSKEYSFAQRYISREKITAHIDGLKPVAGMGKVSEVAGIRIAQGIISIVFLRWLMLNEYTFKK